jgi:hypothetical protein
MKNYSSAISLEKVRNFFAVMHDIGNCQGLMVTKTGYQSGVEQFAAYYGIGLKLLRKTTDQDWAGRVKNIKVNVQMVGLDTSLEKVPRATLVISGDVDAETKDAITNKRFIPSAGADLIFVDAEGIPLTEEMRWWLPKTLAKEKKPVGGPYQKAIPLENHYVELKDAGGVAHRVKVAGLTVEYHYVVKDTREFTIAGEEIVKAILKDNVTSEVEHVHRQ